MRAAARLDSFHQADASTSGGGIRQLSLGSDRGVAGGRLSSRSALALIIERSVRVTEVKILTDAAQRLRAAEEEVTVGAERTRQLAHRRTKVLGGKIHEHVPAEDDVERVGGEQLGLRAGEIALDEAHRSPDAVVDHEVSSLLPKPTCDGCGGVSRSDQAAVACAPRPFEDRGVHVDGHHGGLSVGPDLAHQHDQRVRLFTRRAASAQDARRRRGAAVAEQERAQRVELLPACRKKYVSAHRDLAGDARAAPPGTAQRSRRSRYASASPPWLATRALETSDELTEAPPRRPGRALRQDERKRARASPRRRAPHASASVGPGGSRLPGPLASSRRRAFSRTSTN